MWDDNVIGKEVLPKWETFAKEPGKKEGWHGSFLKGPN